MKPALYRISRTDRLVVFVAGVAALQHLSPFDASHWITYATCAFGDACPLHMHEVL